MVTSSTPRRAAPAPPPQPPTTQRGKGVEPVHRPAEQLAFSVRNNTAKYAQCNNVWLQKHIRIYAMQLMNRETRESAFPTLPTEAELDAFTKYKIGGPTLKEFRVDVSGTKQRSPWNRRCAQLFANEYVKLPNALSANKSQIEKAFLTHVGALCTQYKSLNEGSDKGTSEAAIANVRRCRRGKVSYPFFSASTPGS